MRKINWLLLILLLCTGKAYSQHVYQIRADSVRIYNVCDTAELIIENRTRGVSGYLYNKGNGRTEFRRIRLETVGNNQIAITGQDTLNLSSLSGIGGVDTIYRSGDNIVYIKKGVTYTINAPITSAGDFVRNQSASAQTASAWVSGPIISDSNFYVNRGIGSGTAAHFGLRSTGGLMRFSLGLEGAEAGSDSGANFNIWRYNDAGDAIGSGLSIERSTGNVGIGADTPSSKLHVNGMITANGVTLGAAGNTNAYNLELLRNMGSADRAGRVTLTGNSTVGYGPALHALGSPSRLLLLPDNGTAPYFSDDGGTNYRRIWHENNHPAGIANSQGGGAGLSGPTVYSNIVTNSAGHLTSVATRSLTAENISAIPSNSLTSSDWNNFDGSGFFAGFNTSGTNAPTALTYFGEIATSSTGYGYQTAFRGNAAYYRTLESGTYNPWLQIADRAWVTANFGGSNNLQTVLGNGNAATNNIILGADGNSIGYTFSIKRQIPSGGTDYTGSIGIGLDQTALTFNMSNGVTTKQLFIPASGTSILYSPDGGASKYDVWHENNHPAGTAGSITYSGAEVPASFSFNSAGHYTLGGKRTLTAGDIYAPLSFNPSGVTDFNVAYTGVGAIAQSNLMGVSGITNGPATGIAGAVINVKYDANYGFQLGNTNGQAGSLYFRGRTGGNFGSWLQIADRTWVTANFLPSGSSNTYIQNQFTSAQVGNAWVSGMLRANNRVDVPKNGSNTFTLSTTPHFVLQNAAGDRGAAFQLNGDATPGLSTWVHDGSTWVERLRINAANGEATFRSDDGLGINLVRPINGNGNATGSLSFGALNSSGGGATYARIWGVIGDNTAGTNDGHMGFLTTTNGVLSTKMMLTTSGNLLINTTSDDGGTKLQINGNMKTFGTSENYRMINDGAYISAFNSAQTTRTGFLQFHSLYGVILSADGNIPMHFRTSGAERMTILGNGNVGIKNGSPVAALDVAGDIRASGGNVTSTNGTVNGILTHTTTEVVLGATTNHDVVFRTNNINRLRLYADGRFLISNIPALGSAGTQFLTHTGGLIQYRTAAQVRSDIGAAPASGSGSYIMNQLSSAQSANLWISGAGRTAGQFQVAHEGSNSVAGAFTLYNATLTRGVNFQLNAESTPGLATWIHNGTTWVKRMEQSATNGLLRITADAGEGIRLFRPINVVNGGTGSISFEYGNTANAAAPVVYGQIYGQATTVTAGAENGAIVFNTRNAGTLGERLRIANTGDATFSGNVTLGKAGVTTAYNLGVIRSVSSVNYTARLNVGSAGQAVLTASNGTAASDKSIYLNFSGDPAYSPNGGTTKHTLWHAGNQPVAATGTANTLAKRDASGALYATGFFQSSMATLKENISDFTTPALPLINGLAIKEFTYKADDQHTIHFGIIADNSDWHFATKDHDRFDTNSSLAIAIKAIQELNKENEMLEDKVKSLEERLAKLEKLLK